jgi:hypothetical protein
MLDEQSGFMMQLNEVYSGKLRKELPAKNGSKKVMSVIVFLLVSRYE